MSDMLINIVFILILILLIIKIIKFGVSKILEILLILILLYIGINIFKGDFSIVDTFLNILSNIILQFK